MDDLYRQNILDHFKNPRNYAKMENPDFETEAENIFCGDRIGMGIKVSSRGRSAFGRKIIEEIKFHGEGCAISMAAASMLTEIVKGKKIEEVKKIGKEDILKMLGTSFTPTRLKCALLPLEVLQKTLVLVKDKVNKV